MQTGEIYSGDIPCHQPVPCQCKGKLLLEYKEKDMSDYLSRFCGKKVIILLDEYDTPMQEAYVHGYWREMAGICQ